jgi:uncharacterized protein Veg
MNKMKQISKQSVNINIGNTVVKRKSRRGRRKRAKASKVISQHTFTTPIINYPPNYVNPSVVQPVYGQQSLLIPKPPLPKQYAVFGEGETLGQLGLGYNPIPLRQERAEPLAPVRAQKVAIDFNDPASRAFFAKQGEALAGYSSGLEGDVPLSRPRRGRPRLSEAEKAARAESRRLARENAPVEYRPQGGDIAFVGQPQPPPEPTLERNRP